DLTEAVERRPDDWRLWNTRGVLYDELGQRDRAIADHGRAIELKKDDPVLWLNRAHDYAVTRRYDKAAADYSQALELQPNNLQARAARADAHANAEDWAKAADDYAKLIDQKATNPALWHYLALLRLKQDDAAGYRAVCADMRQRFGRVPDPGVSNSV